MRVHGPVEAAHEQPQEEECSLLCVRRDSNFPRSHCDYALRDSVKRAKQFFGGAENDFPTMFAYCADPSPFAHDASRVIEVDIH